MIITIPKSKLEIPYEKIAPGMIYEIHNGAKLLKLKFGEAVVLCEVRGDIFEKAMMYKDLPAVKILGYIKEIIVGEK